MTTKGSRPATEPRHWSDETADAAVQAAIEARALMLATARALGLPDERVEDAPQEAERLRLAYDEQSALLIAITRHDARACTQLAQAAAALREILAEAEGDFDRDIIITAAQGALRDD